MENSGVKERIELKNEISKLIVELSNDTDLVNDFNLDSDKNLKLKLKVLTMIKNGQEDKVSDKDWAKTFERGNKLE